jgi:uridylate kinase
MEINAEILMKATKVDKIYDKDPTKFPDAKPFDKISYIDVLNRGLKVMDLTAVSLCMDNKLPILSFDLMKQGNILRAVKGESIGTIVH